MSDLGTLNITLFNAGGIGSASIDHIMHNINPNTNLFFITETWLLPSAKLPMTETWQQIHNYGSPVEDRFSGEYGISLLISPSFKYSVLTVYSLSYPNFIIPVKFNTISSSAAIYHHL